MLCAISNGVPEDPVVSLKTGHVYERSVIEKYLAEHNKCPITGQELGKDDLMAIKVGKPVKPRHTPAMSIPGLLGTLHNEWDAVMLEAHELRTQLTSARQELSHALYQHDAACRVIARLLREKDAAQAQLEDLEAQVAAAVRQAGGAGRREEGAEEHENKRPRTTLGMSPERIAEIEAKHGELFAARNARNPAPEGLADRDALAALAAAVTQPLHSTTQPGVLALALAPPAPTAEPALVATGGADHTVQLLDVTSGRVAASLMGHAKKVTALAFASATALVSGGADRTVKVWGRGDVADAPWTLRSAALGQHASPLVRLCTHPVARYVVAVCADAHWQLLDLDAEAAVWSQADASAGSYACAAVHPDGNFFAAGTTAGALRIYDVKTAGMLAEIADGVDGAVRDVAFNENGYWAALACDAGVQVWDLRKTKKALEVAPFAEPVACLAWDHSGKYLACGGATVKVYEVASKGKKKAAEAQAVVSLLDLPKKGVHCIAFGALAHSLYVGAADHNLRKYTC